MIIPVRSILPCRSAGATRPQEWVRYKAAIHQDLLRLDMFRPSCPLAFKTFGPVCTPLGATAWERAMKGHPDPVFMDYLVQGMRQGFRIGFDRSAYQEKSAKRNMRSVSDVPEVVQSYIRNKRARCREGTTTFATCLQHLHVAAAIEDPFAKNPPMSRLEYVMRGIKKDEATKSSGPWERLLITPELLRYRNQAGTSMMSRCCGQHVASAFLHFYMSERGHLPQMFRTTTSAGMSPSTTCDTRQCCASL